MYPLPPKKTGKFRRSLAMLDALLVAGPATRYYTPEDYGETVKAMYRLTKRLHGVRR